MYRQLTSEADLDSPGQEGGVVNAEAGRGRGTIPEWKNLWSEIRSIEGRFVGSGCRREVIRS
jgi:hypothetical protein